MKNYHDRSMILYIIKRFLYTFIEEVEMVDSLRFSHD